MSEERFTRASEGVVHLASAAVIGLVLIAVGQPIFADDTWWHLALGRAYIEAGPWLASDPLAFTTDAPPPPASWLADSFFYCVFRFGGFTGLRALHCGLVLSTIMLVWSLLRRASASAFFASLATALVAGVSAYRFVQLRPHLITILAVFVLYRLLLEKAEAPSWRRVVVAAGVMFVWANSHPMYPLGPVLLLGAVLGLVCAYRSRLIQGGTVESARTKRLAIAAGVCFLATWLHPMGLALYAKAFSVGAGSESLAVVVDEWARFQPFQWPSESLPPSRLTWMTIWMLLLSTSALAVRFIWAWRAPAGERGFPVDPVLVSLACASLLALIAASRFTWLAVFPLALAGAALRPWLVRREAARMLAFGCLAVALIPAFVMLGNWPMVTRGLPRSWDGYKQPYASTKYHAQAVWFLSDTGLQGNLFGRYSEGGFQSFWLGPRIRTAMNGALNMSEASLAESFAVRERLGTPSHPRFEDTLDKMGIDLFLGTGLPMERRPGRPPNYTTVHLENVEGWILVFRNLDSAVYLRRNERNASNLERVANYYSREGIPFDQVRGFDAAHVIRAVPSWARRAGLRTDSLEAWVAEPENAAHWPSASASLLALGLYDAARNLNERVLSQSPRNHAALERRLWLLLKGDGAPQAPEFRRTVAFLAESSGRSGRTDLLLYSAAQLLRGKALPENRLATLLLFSRKEARALRASVRTPEMRVEPNSGARDRR